MCKVKILEEQIEEVHDLFKDHVKKERPQLDLAKVATGEYWYGQQAKDLQLVDELGTSDEFLLKHVDSHTLLEVTFQGKRSLKEKLSESLSFSIVYAG